MESHFSDDQFLVKNGQKSDSFVAHFEQHFKYTTSCMDLCKCMMFKLVNQITPIVPMKSCTKPNFNLCMEEHLNTIKKLCDKHVTLMNQNSDIYGALKRKNTFRPFFLGTVNTINWRKGYNVQWPFNLTVRKPQHSFLVLEIFVELCKDLKNNWLQETKVNQNIC